MGRHAAADDAGTDPIIAAALAAKTADAPGTPRLTVGALRSAGGRPHR